MIELVRYEPWHYEYLAERAGAEAYMGPGVVKFFSEAYLNMGMSYTISDNGNLLGCAGVVEMFKGVAEAWTMLSPEVKQAPMFLHRRTKRILHNIIEFKKFHRVQAVVNLTDERALQWIYALGFEMESRMKGFNPDGSDSGMFVYPIGGI